MRVLFVYITEYAAGFFKRTDLNFKSVNFSISLRLFSLLKSTFKKN